MNGQRFDSVWDAIEDTPEEAENMKLRSVLMMALKKHIERTEMSQAQAAKLFGVTQPRISDLMRGKVGVSGLDALVNMVSAADMHIEMRILSEPKKPSTTKKAPEPTDRKPVSKSTSKRGKTVRTAIATA